MPKQTSMSQLKRFAEEVGLTHIPKTITAHQLIRRIIKRVQFTGIYSTEFLGWYKRLSDHYFNDTGTAKIQVIIDNTDNRPKVFSIETYKSWTIEEKDYRRKFICTSPKGDGFRFSISIDQSSFRPQFECLYFTKDEKGVIMWRGEPTKDIKQFWLDLGDEYFKRTSGYQDQLRDKVLKQFNFNWGE